MTGWKSQQWVMSPCFLHMSGCLTEVLFPENCYPLLGKEGKKSWTESQCFQRAAMGEFQPTPPRWMSSPSHSPPEPTPPVPPSPHPQLLNISSHFIHSHTQGDSGGQFLVSLSPLFWGSFGQVLIFFNVSPSPLLPQGGLMLVLLNTHWLQTQQTLNKEKNSGYGT